MLSVEFPSDIEACGDDINLFDEKTILAQNGELTKDADGFYKSDFNKIHKLYGPNGDGIPIDFKLSTQYTISFIGYTLDTSNIANARGFFFQVKYTDGTTEDLSVNVNKPTAFKLTTAKNKTISNIYATYGHISKNAIKNVKIQKGEVATPYSPFRTR